MTLPPPHVSICPFLSLPDPYVHVPRLPPCPLSPQVAGVPQCPSILSRSLSANITLGWGHKEETQVMAAAQRVGVHTWARQLPHGYDTGRQVFP